MSFIFLRRTRKTTLHVASDPWIPSYMRGDSPPPVVSPPPPNNIPPKKKKEEEGRKNKRPLNSPLKINKPLPSPLRKKRPLPSPLRKKKKPCIAVDVPRLYIIPQLQNDPSYDPSTFALFNFKILVQKVSQI